MPDAAALTRAVGHDRELLPIGKKAVLGSKQWTVRHCIEMLMAPPTRLTFADRRLAADACRYLRLPRAKRERFQAPRPCLGTQPADQVPPQPYLDSPAPTTSAIETCRMILLQPGAGIPRRWSAADHRRNKAFQLPGGEVFSTPAAPRRSPPTCEPQAAAPNTTRGPSDRSRQYQRHHVAVVDHAGEAGQVSPHTENAPAHRQLLSR
jgi:hypothetical protein